MRLTKAQRCVLEMAASRFDGWVCPTFTPTGAPLRGSAQTRVLNRLYEEGLIDGCAPTITEAGRRALEEK